MHDITHMENLKSDTNELIYRTETDSQTENKVTATKGESEDGGWGGYVRSVGLTYAYYCIPTMTYCETQRILFDIF